MRRLAAVALLALAACGDLTGPLASHTSDDAISGKWVAPQIDGFYHVTLDLTVKDSTVTGTWQGVTSTANEIRRAPLPGEGNLRPGGTISGLHTGTALALTLGPPSDMPCGYGLVLALEHKDGTLTGTARNLSCAGSPGIIVFPVTFKR